MDWIEMSAQHAGRVLRSVGLVLVLVRPLATSRPKVQRRRLRLFHCPCRPRRMPRRCSRVPRRDALSRRGVDSATGRRRTGNTNRSRRAQPWRGIWDLRPHFADPAAFDTLLVAVTREMSAVIGRTSCVARVTLVGFSAGYGAIRAILREPRHLARVSAVLLLDGMHTSYVPEGQVLAAGGAGPEADVDRALGDFSRHLRQHHRNGRLDHHGARASPDAGAKWGSRGTQQLSEVRQRRLQVLKFAGTAAPDHIDQLHAMPELLKRLLSR